jgi:TrmH family RNA methyltransferase
MAAPRIDSPANPRVKAWARLRDARERRAARLFLAEGEHLAQEALLARAPIEALVVEDGREFPWLRVPAGVEVVPASERVLKALCETPSPQGIVAVCRLPDAAAPAPGPGRWLLLDGVQDPGNVGSLVRTAHAAGLDGVLLGEGCADAWSPKALRAAQGSTFHLPVATAGLAEWLAGAGASGVEGLATVAAGDGAIDYREARPGAAGWAVVVGSEARGVSDAVLGACVRRLHIPLPGGAESLGAAVAGALVVFRLAEARDGDRGRS